MEGPLRSWDEVRDGPCPDEQFRREVERLDDARVPLLVPEPRVREVVEGLGRPGLLPGRGRHRLHLVDAERAEDDRLAFGRLHPEEPAVLLGGDGRGEEDRRVGERALGPRIERRYLRTGDEHVIGRVGLGFPLASDTVHPVDEVPRLPVRDVHVDERVASRRQRHQAPSRRARAPRRHRRGDGLQHGRLARPRRSPDGRDHPGQRVEVDGHLTREWDQGACPPAVNAHA